MAYRRPEHPRFRTVRARRLVEAAYDDGYVDGYLEGRSDEQTKREKRPGLNRQITRPGRDR